MAFALTPHVPQVDTANPLYCPWISPDKFLSTIHIPPGQHRSFTHLSFYARLTLQVGTDAVNSDQPDFNPLADPNLKREPIDVSDVFSSESNQEVPDMRLDGTPQLYQSGLSQSDSSFTISSKADTLRFPSVLSSDSSSNNFTQGQRPTAGLHVLPGSNSQDAFWGPDNYESYGTRYGVVVAAEDTTEPKGRDLQDRDGSASVKEEYTPDETPTRLNPSLSQSATELIENLTSNGVSKRLFDVCAPPQTDQEVLNILARNGCLDTDTIEAFRGSLIETLSLPNVNGGDGRNILLALKSPPRFPRLAHIDLEGTLLTDFDLVSLRDLPLSILNVKNTGIGNEGIMHLAALKFNLQHLDISDNLRIDNDSVPSLITLLQLAFLDMRGTSLSMDGVRKFSSAVVGNGGRNLTFHVPLDCELYLKNLHLQYKVDLALPFISDPHACKTLSLTALRRNLLAHATCNSSIIVSGGSREASERLEQLLRQRQADIVAKALVFPHTT